MASNTDGFEETDVKSTVEDLVLLKQKEKQIDDRLAILSERIDLCNVVLDDLKALKNVLVKNSFEDLHLKTEKGTEEPLPKQSP